jgi:mannan endo-1,4-beta-mannosidase
VGDHRPSNPDASAEVRRVLDYLAGLAGHGVVLGQHTQTRAQGELAYIHETTGRTPALCGFELLACSPNINYAESGEECLTEVEQNKGTLEQAWQWAERKGLLHFTWHWFSPLYGKDKAFYAEHTPFDARLAVQEGTAEHEALIADLDVMAELLTPFRDRGIPILWRPFHESEGTWFWWGAQGPGTARDLWNIMYDRYTSVHRLTNLIWVWNSPLPEGYVGDDRCDIVSRDVYLPKHVHTDYREQYEELMTITDADKIAALGEIGPMADLAALGVSRVPWTFLMTWSKEWIRAETTAPDVLRAAYHSDYAVTLDKLPALY